MSKPLSIALLVGGVILLVFGLGASDSLGSEVSEAVTGAPTDKTIWLVAGGAILAILGGANLLRTRG